MRFIILSASSLPPGHIGCILKILKYKMNDKPYVERNTPIVRNYTRRDM
jgi:hypothetical protein